MEQSGTARWTQFDTIHIRMIDAAQQSFPAVEEVLAQKTVRPANAARACQTKRRSIAWNGAELPPRA